MVAFKMSKVMIYSHFLNDLSVKISFYLRFSNFITE